MSIATNYAYSKLENLEARLFYILFIAHFFCCTWVYLGNLSGGWVDIELEEGTIQNKENHTLYIAAFSYIMISFTSVGYGEITGPTNLEMSFTLLIELTGLLLYTAIIWDINQLIAASENKETSKVVFLVFLFVGGRTGDMVNGIR